MRQASSKSMSKAPSFACSKARDKQLMYHRPLILVEVTGMGDSVRELFTRASYKIFVPTVRGELIGTSQCAFNTLAVPEEKVRMVNVREGNTWSNSFLLSDA